MPWGLSWGLTPWGDTISSPFAMVSALAVRENVVRVRFAQSVYWTQWGDPFDGSRASNYRITSVAGTVGIDGLPVRDVAVAEVRRVGDDVLAPVVEVDVVADRMFSPFGARYLVEAIGLMSDAGFPLDPARSSAGFDGLYRGLPSVMPDVRAAARDIANPQTLSALLDPLPVTTDANILGTFPRDETGDYARDEGVTTLRKRIIRRLTTRKGSFAHLPGYGVDMPAQVGRLARAGIRQAIAADAEAQIRQEPEVVDVSVTLLTDGAVTRFVVRARTTFGDTIDLNVPFAPIGET